MTGAFDEAIPPQAIHAERAVLGACLLAPLDDGEALAKVKAALRTEQFYDQRHQLIYGAILATSRPDTTTVAEHLNRQKLLDDVGGIAYLTALANGPETTFNVDSYTALIEETARYREAIETVRWAEKALHNIRAPGDSQQIQARLAAALRDPPGTMNELTALGQEAAKVLEQQRQLAPGSLSGLSWGFRDMDNLTGGLEPGKLYIVAARPGMGKTALLLEIALRCCRRHKKPGLVISYEMAVSDLAERLLQSGAMVSGELLRSSRLKTEQWTALERAVNELQGIPLFGLDKPIPLYEVARLGRLLRYRMGDLGLLVVDYLQLVVPEKGKEQNRTEVVSEISRTLKTLARELNCPVVAASQLNRAVEARQDKRPTLGDLRESGAIEQDADVVVMLYRDSYYTKKSRGPNDPPELVEVDFAKVRHGRTGVVKLNWIPEWTRFAEIEWQREG